MSVKFVYQRFIAEINQHRMVLVVEPAAEDIQTAVRRPSLFIGEPTRQLLTEDLLAQLLQDFADVIFRVTLWDQVDGRLLSTPAKNGAIFASLGRSHRASSE